MPTALGTVFMEAHAHYTHDNREGDTFMRIALPFLFLSASLAGASGLSGTWKFTPPPNPQAPANRQPRETIYVFKEDGSHFMGTQVVNGGIADIRNGLIEGSHITFDRYDGAGRTTAY